jgi:putative glutamine amidotransferase
VSLLIGVTAWLHRARWSDMDEDAAVVEESFLTKLNEFDTPVVVVPPYAPHAAQIVERLDGLVLTGGPDIDPQQYGEARHVQTKNDDPRRDAGEIALARAALSRGIPVLGICRGCQVLNVACGGTLVQHVPDAFTGVTHEPDPLATGDRVAFTKHGVVADPDSLLAGILGERFAVNSAHHQAVRTVAADLKAIGWSSDGLVEAIAHRRYRFALGVQWHPEVESGRALFEALVDAGR